MELTTTKRQRKIFKKKDGEIVLPAAQAKPGGNVILNPKQNKVAEFIRTFGANEYRWLQLGMQLNLQP